MIPAHPVSKSISAVELAVYCETFAGSITHDFNPLLSLLISVDLLVLQAPEPFTVLKI